ncbi:murein biosynthesis integral membrane protein MurJ [Romboutsia timonensis]|uniref:murein biosynthesis integral membrane protein MurJ n=1 Tax=Romboutsia timonensis TaxID=1776391 RepID=UPI003996430F
MNKVAKSTVILMLVTMMSKVLGFIRELVLTYFYGTTQISDVYITSSTIPTILFASIGTAIVTTLIPLFYEVEKNDGKDKSIKFVNNILNIVIIISIIISILGYIFAEPLVKLFAMNFYGDKLKIAVEFTRIMIFGTIFIGLSKIMTSWLQINGEFTIPGMIGFPFNICIILGIAISSKGNINMMAIGTLIAMASQLLIQLPFAIKKGYKYKLYINLKDEYIKKILVLIVPVFIGVGVDQVNTIADRSLASTLGDGIITVLNGAYRLNGFVLGIFIATVASVIYPTLSKLSSEDNKEKFISSVVKSINTIVILIIPISVGAIVLAEPIVKIVFERGAFNSDATRMTAIALSCYSIGMIGSGLREILNRVFYSLQDTKTPMINGAFAMVINIILNIILINFLGYAGLAIGTSISSLICIILLFNSLKKKIRYFGQDKIIKTMIKSLIASIIMGVITYIVYNILINILGIGVIFEVIALFAAICIGAIIYGIAVTILRIEEVSIVTELLRKKLNINNNHGKHNKFNIN